MRRGGAVAAAAAVLLVLPVLPAYAAGVTPAPVAPAPTVRTADSVARAWRAAAPATVLVGRSVRGRAIVATRQGPADAPAVLLVLGQMHGSEPRGRDVVRSVRSLPPPPGVQVWTISTMNPDGAAARTRVNARGVDLNRNFPYAWVHRWTAPWFFPGPRPASEPETRAMMAFLQTLRPGLVVSLHQAYTSIDAGSGKSVVWATRLSAALGLPLRTVPCGTGPCGGTLKQWFEHAQPGVAITVELPRTVGPSLALAYARGILRVGTLLAR